LGDAFGWALDLGSAGSDFDSTSGASWDQFKPALLTFGYEALHKCFLSEREWDGWMNFKVSQAWG